MITLRRLFDPNPDNPGACVAGSLDSRNVAANATETEVAGRQGPTSPAVMINAVLSASGVPVMRTTRR
jgi:hypothetical protein